ncbi:MULTISPECIES: hypothetical protein [unclassified Microcoleus]|uniref:hypothetical protein n=1 Tax=unclassified Microcoleus TaxID=2642155 RepID=UPI0025D5D3D1|nr:MULTISPECIES: hypothetical protein [unclassified Microcoleus]
MTISSDAINCHAMQLDDRILAQPPRGSPQQIGNCGRRFLYCGQELRPEYLDFWSFRADRETTRVCYRRVSGFNRPQPRKRFDKSV